MIPHSHDDVGWLKTVDQYYWGYKNYIDWSSVASILDSVVDELQKDVTRHFIFVEVAFFYRWYKEQTKQRQNIANRLI